MEGIWQFQSIWQQLDSVLPDASRNSGSLRQDLLCASEMNS